MITLRDKGTGTVIGQIGEDQLKLLIDAFEEESSRDRDYYVEVATLDFLADEVPGSTEIVALLRSALGGRDGMDIVWERS
jgi:hypothetical protein